VDNLTHSLAGLVVADAAIQLRARFHASKVAPRGFREAALATGVLASNLPDLDFAYAGITAGKLGYLLHHRGHTHTLLMVLPLSLVCVGVVALALRVRGLRLAASDHRSLLGLAAGSGCLHMLMDFGNNYGVHPFWPLNNDWYYGDAIFIIEPWLLIALSGIALGASESRVLRGLLMAGVAGLLALAWSHPFTGPVLDSLLSASALLWLIWMRRATPRRRLASGSAAIITLWLCLLGTRHLARGSVRGALAKDSSLRLISLVSTPAPANPLCWSILAVQQSKSEYVVRQAVVSGWPGVSSALRCNWPSPVVTAPLQAPSLPSTGLDGSIEWGPEFRAPFAELLATRQGDCMAAAFLRFARVPFWIRSGQRTTLIGDLRYDRSPDIDFAELELHPDADCPAFEPPWRPPLPSLRD
jgi:inner membrane protein